MSMTTKIKAKMTQQSILVKALDRRIEDANTQVNGKQVSFQLPAEINGQSLPHYARKATMDFATGELSHDEDYTEQISTYVDQIYRAEQVISAADEAGLIYEESLNAEGEIVLEVLHG